MHTINKHGIISEIKMINISVAGMKTNDSIYVFQKMDNGPFFLAQSNSCKFTDAIIHDTNYKFLNQS